MKSIEVFISYHQKDEELREELEKHLATLLREQTITSWHKREIIAGQEFQDEINKYLKRAGLILLLVSPDFIASDYHWTVEVTRALEQNAAGKARVIPILLRHADWDNPPIDKLSPLPSNRKPIKSWSDRDEAFLEVVKGIRQEVARLVASSNYSPPKDSSANQKPLALKPATDNASSQPNNQIQTDLTLELPLSIAELTYGTEKKIALDDGSITVTVPSGFSPGKKLRIRGKGKLNQITNQRGDLYLKVVSVQKVEVSLEDYQQKLQQYEQELIQILQLEYPLSDHSRKGLKNYQQLLKLRDEDVTLLEEQVTAQELEKRQDKVTRMINEADGLRKEKKLEEAALKYKAALHLDQNSVLAQNILVFVLYKLDKLEEAITAYQKALLLNPNFATAHNNLGNALFDKLEEAMAAYHAMIAAPNHRAIQQAIAAYQQALHYQKALCLVALNNLGNALYDQGKLEQAITVYQKALHLDPNSATTHNNRANALFNQGKLEEAIAAYQRALRLDPNFATAHNNLGFALFNQGKLEEALAAYQKALSLNPDSAKAHNNLGNALYDQGKLEEAIAEYHQALRLDPSFAYAHNNLGNALYNRGKLEEAITEYQSALHLNPDSAKAHNNLGSALFNQGKLEEAIAAYQRALQLDPNLAMAHNNLGIALFAQGKLKEGIAKLGVGIWKDLFGE